MVKLFKRKTEKKQRDFRFETSLKLRDLPLEEYAHLAHAFQVNALRFERMLKESLLEGFITSTTLERVSRGFQFAKIRGFEIPRYDSVTKLFGSETEGLARPRAAPKPEPTEPTPISEPTASPTPSLPATPLPSPVSTLPPSSSPAASPSSISYAFPEAPTIGRPSPSPSSSSPPGITTPVMPEKQDLSPSIPKISFPNATRPSSPSSVGPLGGTKRSGGEEDRATGIAILRKQMLSELKKIRSVVAEPK